ncbi:MAG: serine hydrolase [Clostridiales bacterium]|nr:serine hydrolase [Clostridiales bacterium]
MDNMFITLGKTEVKPEEVGYDSSRIDAVHEHFRWLIEDKKLIQSAAYCVSRKGKIFMSGAVGASSSNTEVPRKPDDICTVASTTKMITATAIMKLVEDGLLRLDTQVCTILPQFSKEPLNQVTVFQLLTHTSGLYPDDSADWSGLSQPEIGYWGYIEKHIDDVVENGVEFDWVSASMKQGLRKKPGSEWAYCSFGFSILGAIIEKLTGVFAHDYIEKELFAPLEMDDSFFTIPKEKAARIYSYSDWMKNRVNKILNDESNDSPHDNYYSQIPKCGGGVFSTVYDMVRFGNMLLYKGSFDGQRVVGKKAIERMTKRSLFNMPCYCWNGNDPDFIYGVGCDMKGQTSMIHSEGTFFHEGAGACGTFIDPKEELVASWFVPLFDQSGWPNEAMAGTVNVVWSGLI